MANMAQSLSNSQRVMASEYLQKSGITLTLCAIFAVVYIGLMIIHPHQRLTIIESLGVKNHLDYGILTATFIHAGLQHVLGNSINILVIGSWLENKLGKKKYLLSVFLCTISAWLFYILRHPEKTAVGASGLVFGLWSMFFSYQHRVIFLAVFILGTIWLGFAWSQPIPNQQDIHAMGFMVGCLLSFVWKNLNE